MKEGEWDPRGEIGAKSRGGELPGGHRESPEGLGSPGKSIGSSASQQAPGWGLPGTVDSRRPQAPPPGALGGCCPRQGHRRGGADRVASGHPMHGGTHLSLYKPRDSLEAGAAGPLTTCPTPQGAQLLFIVPEAGSRRFKRRDSTSQPVLVLLLGASQIFRFKPPKLQRPRPEVAHHTTTVHPMLPHPGPRREPGWKPLWQPEPGRPDSPRVSTETPRAAHLTGHLPATFQEKVRAPQPTPFISGLSLLTHRPACGLGLRTLDARKEMLWMSKLT